MDRAALISSLQTTSHLRHSFSAAELAELAQHLSPESISSGETVMRQGEPADSMIFILEGSVQILEGERKIAGIRAGDFAGESLFSDTAIRNADVQAVENTVIATFSIHNFNQFLSDNQKLALKFRDFFKTIGLLGSTEPGRPLPGSAPLSRPDCPQQHERGADGVLPDPCRQAGPVPLIATGTTGSLLFKKTGLLLTRKVASGPLGGDQAIGTLISTKNICGVIFFAIRSPPIHTTPISKPSAASATSIKFPLAPIPTVGKPSSTTCWRGKAINRPSLTMFWRPTPKARARWWKPADPQRGSSGRRQSPLQLGAGGLQRIG